MPENRRPSDAELQRRFINQVETWNLSSVDQATSEHLEQMLVKLKPEPDATKTNGRKKAEAV